MATTTRRFSPHTIGTAPENAAKLLDTVESKLGFIPNLIGTLAHAPVALEAYLTLDSIFSKSTFTPVERQIILFAASLENDCHYCLAAHGTVLQKQLKVSTDQLNSVRKAEDSGDAKLDVLVQTVREVVRRKGKVDSTTIQEFLNAGYKEQQLIEILVGVSMKTLSNYLVHLDPVDIDEAFNA